MTVILGYICFWGAYACSGFFFVCKALFFCIMKIPREVAGSECSGVNTKPYIPVFY